MSDKVRNFFNRCEHPRIIKNKYTGDPVYVECGTCPHCLISRSDAKRNLCDYEKWNRKYCYFVTLTYNSQYVPKMALVPIEDYKFDYPIGKNWPCVKTQLHMRLMLDPRVKKTEMFSQETRMRARRPVGDQLVNMFTCKVNKPYIDEHLKAIFDSCAAAVEFRKNYEPTYQSPARPYILRTVPRISKLHNFKDVQCEELVWLSPEYAEKLKKKSKCEGNGNAFPQFKGLLKYVNYRDYQLFAKRFRKYLFTKIGSYEKISSSLDISEVVNTNLSSGDVQSEAVIAGKGVGSSQGSEKFEARDWGVLMCIYHNVPLLDYVSSAPDPQFFVSQNTDLPIPELDSIGMQSVPISMYSNSNNELVTGFLTGDYTMGYLPRYYNWKTSYDYVLGAFTTTEKEWVAPITPSIWKNMLSTVTTASSSVTYNIFKVNPSVLDSIFQVNADSKWDTDPFLINCAFDVKVVRNLDYSGMPY
jgi:hypothetical protein